MSPTGLAQLCAFLYDRTALRRLCLTFEIATEGLPTYLKTIATRKNMEIFDLRIGNRPSYRSFLAALTWCLPTTLNGMELTTAGLCLIRIPSLQLYVPRLGTRPWLQLTDSTAVAVLLCSLLALRAHMRVYDRIC